MIWWYNILGDNDGGISYILKLNPITVGSFLLTIKLVALKRGNYEPILIVKRTEWRKFIDYFGLSIQVDQPRGAKIINIFSILSLYQALHLEVPM